MEEDEAVEVTAPYKVKSSNLNVPVDVAPDIVNIIVIVPVRADTGELTAVDPNEAPVVGIVPDPTDELFIVIAQF